MRNLVLVLGDQLTHDSEAFRDFDRSCDAVWMAEVEEEATYVWSHRLRLVYFFSAMRHFRKALKSKKIPVHYHPLQKDRRKDRGTDFAAVLKKDVRKLDPEKLVVVTPGDYRVLAALQQAAKAVGLPLEVRRDRSFFCSQEAFRDHARGKKSLVMEHFYRRMRREQNVLVKAGGKPVGGQWNFDRENRDSFGKQGPEKIPKRPLFSNDSITRDVLSLVRGRFGDHPGHLDGPLLPVTRRDSLKFLRHFIDRVLPNFGRYEDAMWVDEPFLYHSRLSALINVKLLHPEECVAAAVEAYDSGAAPINSVEGFVRQILGWREYIRGVYWLKMPEYGEMNYLGHTLDLPSFYWDGDTDMHCLRQSMAHVLSYAYAHHIHRLMVLGLFSLLYGAHPAKFHQWHMAMYADAIDWVSLPNTLGMSQYGDGGLVGTKPYCATGAYIDRMSNFCAPCRYQPRESIGEDACPFTTLYWEFLDRHDDKLKTNRRLAFQLRNLEKKRGKKDEMKAIRQAADRLRKKWRPQTRRGQS